MKMICATASDVHRAIPCARAFCATLNWPFQEEQYATFLAGLVSGDSGVVFLLEDGEEIAGGIGGRLQPEPLSGMILAVELFWFMLPKHRGGMGGIKLLKAFEGWGASRGAKQIAMIAMADSMPEGMEKLYGRLGYRKLETTYIKAA